MTYKEYIKETFTAEIADKLIRNIKKLRNGNILETKFNKKWEKDVSWCFAWGSSPEGFVYWSEINSNIEKHLKGSRTHKKVKNLKKFKDVKHVKWNSASRGKEYGT